MVIAKKSVVEVEVALELVQSEPIVDISNKKGIESAKLPKDQVFLKACRTYHAILESWIRTHQLISYKTCQSPQMLVMIEKT